ncbi:MAG: flavodoxin family protein [Dehalococcoidales bacterium]|nr:flavodoxin family protein [Dehalococcoidales bacterium]
MKVLGISCSSRKGGNSEVLVSEALAAAKEMGAEVELLSVAGKNIGGCDGCEACTKTGKCKINDDMQLFYDKMLAADGIIFGTPVYFWDVSAQAKAIIDRTYALRKAKQLRGKVAGVLVVARRAGTTHAFSTFNNFFVLQRMVSAGGSLGYTTEEEFRAERGGGGIAFGDGKGDVINDKRGIGEARALGKSVAKTIEVLQKGKAQGLIK